MIPFQFIAFLTKELLVLPLVFPVFGERRYMINGYIIRFGRPFFMATITAVLLFFKKALFVDFAARCVHLCVTDLPRGMSPLPATGQASASQIA